MPKHAYGYIPDREDKHDYLYEAHPALIMNLPSHIDLRPHCPPIYDQGPLGACTANAIAAAIEYNQIKAGLPEVTPSRLFIYYNERRMEGTITTDSGAMIRDGIKSVAKLGACAETEWPYDVSQFALAPPQACYTNAAQHLVTSYQRVPQVLGQMQSCLALGEIFVFGFEVYESFESEMVAQTGNAPMPSPGEQRRGGHAVVAVGYNNDTRQFLCRNSWSASWGMAGYFTLSFDYLLSSDLAHDFWMIRSVE